MKENEGKWRKGGIFYETAFSLWRESEDKMNENEGKRKENEENMKENEEKMKWNERKRGIAFP